MAAPLPLRDDYDVPALRRLPMRSDDAGQIRRLLALAAVYDGGSRSDAAAMGGVGLQTVRDWVLAFNAAGAGRACERQGAGEPATAWRA